jgi:hypothetical protein
VKHYQNRALSNQVFTNTGVHKEYTKGDEQNKQNMQYMANEVAKCLKTAQNNGKPIITQRGI